MHIYFSGIGGAGIGPLAQIARQAGYTVSGSDKQDSQYIQYLRAHGVTDIHIGQSHAAIAASHARQSIDWFVYTSALPLENPNAPELAFCREQHIKTSKRDELLNTILHDKKLALIAIAGTHGKTTTTALVTWLFKRLEQPLSYLLPAKVSFGDMGEYDPASKYFVYEADEFDRNFLAYEPAISLITGVSWDHHEIFPTREDYQLAFRDFINQTKYTIVWQDDASYLQLGTGESRLSVQDSGNPSIAQLTLKGFYNRLDAWLAIQAVQRACGAPLATLIAHANAFPGLARRMEQVWPGLYSDYAHTPEKIRGAMSVALEMAADSGQNVVVVYQPLTNRRQHFQIDDYGDCFSGAEKVYWLPSYLAREDPSQRIISPAELIAHLADPSLAVPAEPNAQLKQTLQKHLAAGDMVVAMVGGGGGSLDDWLRAEFKA
ncbi:MAG: Mur ligase domain-containing protein [Candidatus Saccharibacteria bacterium]